MEKVRIRVIGFGPCDVPNMCEGKIHSGHHPSSNGSGDQRFRFTPSRPFRPAGILLWNPTDHTYITSIAIGPTENLVAAAPGSMFRAKWPLSEMMLVLSRDESMFIKMAKGQYGTDLLLSTVDITSRMVIEVRGPFDDIAVWGYEAITKS